MDLLVTATFALILLAIGACCAAIIESLLYRRSLRRIPIRIHVNGTRGKSSVTRLIAAGLRAGGVRTCAKTTGTLARMILSDGRELPIFRPSRANIIEQKRVVRAAVADGAQALVIECMALQPVLQSVCERKLVRSTHGVITNTREDHLDVMGPSRIDVAEALAGTVSIGGRLFTAERRSDCLRVLASAASDRGSTFEPVTDHHRDQITEQQMLGFSYLEHPENVALALNVCQSLGVDRQLALRGMWKATPDPGAMRVHRQVIAGRPVHFVNAFAANDPESTTEIWNSTWNQFGEAAERVVVMNCRVDRPDRSRTMAQVCATWRGVNQFVVIGTGTDIFLRGLLKQHVNAERILCLGSAEPIEVVEAVSQTASRGAMMMGIGNVHGTGMSLIDFFESQVERTCEPAKVIETPALLEVA
jgi:poly-gamma-glutamate synthase PgsB/CapB